MKLIRDTVRVATQEEALAFYVGQLGFEKRSDLVWGPNYRWLTVAPVEEGSVELVLQPSEWFEGADRDRHDRLIGSDPTRVFEVDDCQKNYEVLTARGVEFTLAPSERPYGWESHAKDLYGNTLVFLQPRP